jgi:uncharacterized membrane protein (DUF2068 family)
MKGKERSDRVILWIGGFKLLKAALLIATAAGLLSMLHKDQAEVITKLAHRLSVDPNAHYFRMFAERFMALSPKIPLITIGLFFYAALFTTEGVGLLMRKRWGEYFTVITTSAFLPLEGYEMIHRVSVVKGVVIALNLAIVVYLIWRLRHHKGHETKQKEHVRARRRHGWLHRVASGGNLQSR